MAASAHPAALTNPTAPPEPHLAVQDALRERDEANQGLTQQLEEQCAAVRRLEAQLGASEKTVAGLRQQVRRLEQEGEFQGQLLHRRTGELRAAQEAVLDAEHASSFALIEREFGEEEDRRHSPSPSPSP